MTNKVEFLHAALDACEKIGQPVDLTSAQREALKQLYEEYTQHMDVLRNEMTSLNTQTALLDHREARLYTAKSATTVGMDESRWSAMMQEAREVQYGMYDEAGSFMRRYIEEQKKDIESMSFEQFYRFVLEVI